MAASYSDEEGGTLSDINVVPLVDVVLVLLIVFMITVPAVIGSAPIKVDVPETSSAAMGAAENLPLHLTLKKTSAGEVVLYRNDEPTNEQALRDCTARLRQATGALLLSPEPHPVLLRAGESLADAGLAESAIGYWQAMMDATRPILGPVDPPAIRVRARLADAYQAAGEHSTAIAGYERLLADCERGLGPEHPDTLSVRSSLARAYGAAGRAGDRGRAAGALRSGADPAVYSRRPRRRG